MSFFNNSRHAVEGLGRVRLPRITFSRAAVAQPPPHGKRRVIGGHAALQYSQIRGTCVRLVNNIISILTLYIGGAWGRAEGPSTPPPESTMNIETIAVLGCGTMGAGIAQAALSAGCAA